MEELQQPLRSSIAHCGQALPHLQPLAPTEVPSTPLLLPFPECSTNGILIVVL